MAKPATQFVCQECGAAQAKWCGQCSHCGAWDTLIEELPVARPKAIAVKKGTGLSVVPISKDEGESYRIPTGIGELDRVLGGGIVPGSAILIGGDPGIGKSTLLLQMAATLAMGNNQCLYVSGEESTAQISDRAIRLGLEHAPLQLSASASVKDIAATLDKPNAAEVTVIDSIQTLFVDSLDAAPGTVSQVRAAAHELIRIAKERRMAVFIVGHVTKDGQIAGPRVLEHMVDTVLYFEGERGNQFRILRAVKNRFGGTDEIGVFQMIEAGLAEVTNPSSLFLSERDAPVSGSAVFAGMEGSRPVLVEVQALVAPSNMATPRRAVVGWDSNRLSMLLAVLEARCGISLANREVYLNVTGGFRVSEPGADLAVAAAILSAYADRPMEDGTILFGEIGLSGEVRAISHAEKRLNEACKLGFTQAVFPRRSKPSGMDMQFHPISHLRELADWLGVE